MSIKEIESIINNFAKQKIPGPRGGRLRGVPAGPGQAPGEGQPEGEEGFLLCAGAQVRVGWTKVQGPAPGQTGRDSGSTPASPNSGYGLPLESADYRGRHGPQKLR